MCGIALPVLFDGQRLSAKADAGVSLDDGEARGIHMSRLYLALEMLEQESLTPALLKRVLQNFLESHDGLSNTAYLKIHADLLLKRPALISPFAGWKTYPVSIEARLQSRMFHVELKMIRCRAWRAGSTAPVKAAANCRRKRRAYRWYVVLRRARTSGPASTFAGVESAWH